MPSYSFGEIVILPFSYSDLRDSKRRPALVILDSEDGDVLVAKITSKKIESLFDLPIQEWKSAGLNAPSFIRIHKLLAIESDHVVRRIGKLVELDRTTVRSLFRSMV